MYPDTFYDRSRGDYKSGYQNRYKEISPNHNLYDCIYIIFYYLFRFGIFGKENQEKRNTGIEEGAEDETFIDNHAVFIRRT